MKQIIFVVVISILLQGCIVSRLGRPKLTGYVFDIESKQPIKRCSVGESFTDVTGYYELKEKRYVEIAMLGGEAPPVFVQEIVKNKGYIEDTIQSFMMYGGSGRKGTHWENDTIFLQKINQKVQLQKTDHIKH